MESEVLLLIGSKANLTNRKQCTEIGNFQSKLDYVKNGVPQGSVLGPFLFLLYINDIILSSKICKFTLFADDTSLFYSHKNKKEGSKILNEELLKIAEWLAANKLSLNAKKSKLLIFSNKYIIKSNNNTEVSIAEVTDRSPEESDTEIYINGEKLNEVDHAKYGVLVNNELNWSYHINYAPSYILRSLHFSFIGPYIDYNFLNWGVASFTNLYVINIKVKKA